MECTKYLDTVKRQLKTHRTAEIFHLDSHSNGRRNFLAYTVLVELCCWRELKENIRDTFACPLPLTLIRYKYY